MSFALTNVRDGFAFVFFLQWVLMATLDRAELKARMASLLGNATRPPLLWIGPGESRLFRVLYPPWLVVYFIHTAIEHPATGQRPKSPMLAAFVMLAIVVSVIGILIAIGRWHSGRISLAEYSVSRGKLLSAVRRLAGKARFFLQTSTPLFVLPEENFASLCLRMRAGVIIPRRLLDELSRAEIDSIGAGQLALQSPRVYSIVFWPALAVNGAVAWAAYVLHLDGLAIIAFMLSVAAIELLALRLLIPWLILRAALYSIELAGDAEAFFSAIGYLERFGGTPLSKSMLEEIGRRNQIPRDRIAALLAGHAVPLEVDRYPTSGSYLDTGL
jgi:hypothetical protein